MLHQCSVYCMNRIVMSFVVCGIDDLALSSVTMQKHLRGVAGLCTEAPNVVVDVEALQ